MAILEGDVSIRYQAQRDLLDRDLPELRSRIAEEGWGARFLSRRNANGSWGRGFYQPKRKSSHYTLVDLKTLAVCPDHPAIGESIRKISREQRRARTGV